MPTIKDENDITQDARNVLNTARLDLADFTAFDKGRKPPLLGAGYLDRFEAKIVAAEAAVDGADAKKQDKMASTSEEAAARSVLYESVGAVRAEVSISHKGDRATQRAFGAGRKMSPGSTRDVLGVARLLLTSYANPKKQKKAVAAAITAERIAEIAAQAHTLQQARSAHSQEQSTGRVTTEEKQAMLDELKKITAHIRQVARVMYRKRPTQYARYKTTIVASAPRVRAPKVIAPEPVKPPPVEGDAGAANAPANSNGVAEAQSTSAPAAKSTAATQPAAAALQAARSAPAARANKGEAARRTKGSERKSATVKSVSRKRGARRTTA